MENGRKGSPVTTVNTEIIGGKGSKGKHYEHLPLSKVSRVCFHNINGGICNRPGFGRANLLCQEAFDRGRCGATIQVSPDQTLDQVLQSGKKR